MGWPKIIWNLNCPLFSCPNMFCSCTFRNTIKLNFWVDDFLYELYKVNDSDRCCGSRTEVDKSISLGSHNPTMGPYKLWVCKVCLNCCNYGIFFFFSSGIFNQKNNNNGYAIYDTPNIHRTSWDLLWGIDEKNHINRFIWFLNR